MIRITFLSNGGKTVEAAENSNLLRVSLREQGGIPFKCGGGLCGTCRCQVVEGIEHTDQIKPKERKHLSEADIANNMRMACQTFVAGDIAVAWSGSPKVPDRMSAPAPLPPTRSQRGREMSTAALARPAPDVDADVFLNHIDGEWTRSSTRITFANTNPADTNDVVGHFQASSAQDAARAVQAAHAAFAAWRAAPVSVRAGVLERAAAHLEARADQIAAELTREEGKPLGQSREEVVRAARTLRFYAVEAQTITGEVFPQDDAAMEVSTLREPLGVVSVITPWNFPISIPARKIAPALVTGNTVVFKPSSDAPLSGYRLAEAFIAAGLPRGVLNFVTGSATEIGPALTEPEQVRAVTFTGSTEAGRRIQQSVAFTTRTQMELGGKNPLVVMEDADLDQAVELAIKGGLSLNGQACTGTSRIIVMAQVKAAFTERLVARVSALRIGPGTMSGTEIGPLATARQLETVLGYIEVGKGEATLLCGGERLTGGIFERGYYVRPAVFTDVTQAMRIAQEEIFGPVLAIIEADDYADALAKANDTPYGLSAAIVTSNPRHMHAFARDIQSGTVKINRTTTGNLINAPFGGLKQSSTSTFRESGRAGLDFFLQTKTVYRGC